MEDSPQRLRMATDPYTETLLREADSLIALLVTHKQKLSTKPIREALEKAICIVEKEVSRQKKNNQKNMQELQMSLVGVASSLPPD